MCCRHFGECRLHGKRGHGCGSIHCLSNECILCVPQLLLERRNSLLVARLDLINIIREE